MPVLSEIGLWPLIDKRKQLFFLKWRLRFFFGAIALEISGAGPSYDSESP
jgi:hypothetical protein